MPTTGAALVKAADVWGATGVTEVVAGWTEPVVPATDVAGEPVVETVAGPTVESADAVVVGFEVVATGDTAVGAAAAGSAGCGAGVGCPL